MGEVEVECEQCGETFEAYPSEKRKFCSKVCSSKDKSENSTGEKNPSWKGGKIETECEWCGDIIEVYPSRSDQKFCSKKCEGKWMSENRTGEDAPNWQGGKKTIYCKNCGRKMKLWPSIKEQRGYCSQKCMKEDYENRYQGEKNPCWKEKIKKKCKECGERFEVKPSNDNRVFCSWECYKDSLPSLIVKKCKECRKEFRVRPSRKDACFCSKECRDKNQIKNDNYKGFNHRVRRSPVYKKFLNEVKKRDDHTCQFPGCDMKKNLEVHHIIPTRMCYDRGEYGLFIDEKNAITLCINCHRKTFGAEEKYKKLFFKIIGDNHD